MGRRHLAELSWESFDRLDRRRLVALLPVGATEAHGPHLPLSTDVLIAEAMARAAAERLGAEGVQAVLLPPLAYSPAPFAAGFAGTISVRPATFTALVADIGLALHAQGVNCVGIANAHLDPDHLAALAEAVATLSEAGLAIAFPDLTRRRVAERLTDEFRSGACHAGQYETSIILAERPDLVDDATRATLAAVPHSLSAAIRDGHRTFEEVGGDRAYFGDPAAATAAEGERTIAELGRILAEAVHDALRLRERT
jgi:creatinine amidohydrolase